MSDTQTVTVSIMDKDYQVSCAPDEVTALRQSAQYLDEKMREIKSSSNVFGLDRLAVMAALNIANDLLSQTQKPLTWPPAIELKFNYLTVNLTRHLRD